MAKAVIVLLSLELEDRLILFGYLMAFTACVLFNIFDVTLFDLRMNTLTWVILSAIAGVSHSKIRSTPTI